MARGLTPKQEKFAQVYVETGNASEAYRAAYACERMKSATVNRRAFDQLENGGAGGRRGLRLGFGECVHSGFQQANT